MAREVTDKHGITWSCIQAFAGLSKDREKTDAARVEGSKDLVHVVCTPSGGARSVRVELALDWEESSSDRLLLDAIRSADERS